MKIERVVRSVIVLTNEIADIESVVIGPKSVVHTRVPATVSTYDVVGCRNRKRRECGEKNEEEEEG